MATLTIQPSDIDTYLYQYFPNSNDGSGVSVNVSAQSGGVRRSLLKFDFSSLPAGAIISAATLSLYYFDYLGNLPTGRTYWAYELTQREWVELEATWNSYKTGSAWENAGGDYTTGDGASIIMPQSYDWVNWNVLALVQHFQSIHAEVAHFLIKDGSEGTTYGARFYSRNYTIDPTLCPKLVITYTAAQHHTLTAEAGSYSITGQTAGLRGALKVSAAPSSYVLAGQPVDLKRARKIAAGAGSYLLTGQDAVLRAIRKIAAEGGSYVLTGMDANLVLGKHYTLVCESGYYGEPYSKIFVTLDGRIYKKMGDTYLRIS